MFRAALQVGNLDHAVAFYTKLLGVEGRPVAGTRHYFDCGPVILALIDASSESGAAKTGPEDLYFAVDDLEAVHARAIELDCLSKADVHGEPAGEPIVRPWRERSFYVEDPDGNGLCFVDATTLFTGRRPPA
jgi:catechol 2,3-dioxygenase-like lactoylglutathione lyase family enzyme